MTAPAPLDSLEIETHAAPNASILWLHGLGAHGSDFIEAIPELDLPASAALRFVFPHAPVIPVTCNGGYPMRAWYDILALDNSGRRIDAAGLFDNRAALRALIARERARRLLARRRPGLCHRAHSPGTPWRADRPVDLPADPRAPCPRVRPRQCRPAALHRSRRPRRRRSARTRPRGARHPRRRRLPRALAALPQAAARPRPRTAARSRRLDHGPAERRLSPQGNRSAAPPAQGIWTQKQFHTIENRYYLKYNGRVV